MREFRRVPHRVCQEGSNTLLPDSSFCCKVAVFLQPLRSSLEPQLPPNRQFTEILDCSDACAVTNCKEVGVPPPAPHALRSPTRPAGDCRRRYACFPRCSSRGGTG
jgi:hypothetical protein